MFKDEIKKTWEPKSEATIDHTTPVVVHWNTKQGNNVNQTARLDWLDDTTNHRITAKKYNSSEGGKLGITYTWEIGANFRGPGEDNL